MTGFNLFLIGITWLIWKLGAPLIFPIVFGGFALLMTLLMLPMVFSNKRLEIRSDELVSSGGLSRAKRRIPLSGVKSVSTHRGMSSGDRVYFSVRVKDDQGRSVMLTPNLRPASTAEALAAEIRRRVAAASV